MKSSEKRVHLFTGVSPEEAKKKAKEELEKRLKEQAERDAQKTPPKIYPETSKKRPLSFKDAQAGEKEEE